MRRQAQRLDRVYRLMERTVSWAVAWPPPRV